MTRSVQAAPRADRREEHDMAAPRSIDINADAGESFGRWRLGNDEELFAHVTTVNIACGYHAGDPATMRRALAGARDAGCSIGAHPGFPDLLGFGRRALPVSDSDMVDYILYQTGALSALAADEGVVLTHVKPHGAMAAAVYPRAEGAIAIGRALQAVRAGLPLVLAPTTPAFLALRAAGLPVIADQAADLEFTDDGRNVIEPVPLAKDPDLVAESALRLAAGSALTESGQLIDMPVQTICVHGDRPNAVAVAAAVRARLTAAGHTVRSMFASTTDGGAPGPTRHGSGRR